MQSKCQIHPYLRPFFANFTGLSVVRQITVEGASTNSCLYEQRELPVLQWHNCEWREFSRFFSWVHATNISTHKVSYCYFFFSFSFSIFSHIPTRTVMAFSFPIFTPNVPNINTVCKNDLVLRSTTAGFNFFTNIIWKIGKPEEN